MSDQITQLLADWRQGDSVARDHLVALVYPQLHALASRQLAGERRNHTLQPTALVNEVYLRLGGVARVQWNDRHHFAAVAARLMREILVDHARRRGAAKRDGGERLSLTQLDLAGEADGGEIDVEVLDTVLQRLEALDADKGRIVELRYFGGLTIEETAQAMSMSVATVKRHWQVARTWLFDALSA